MNFFSQLLLEIKNFKTIFPKKDRKSILIILCVISIAAIVYLPVTHKLELKILDLKSRATANWLPNHKDSDLLILGIDGETLKKTKENWPWSLNHWQTILNQIDKRFEPKLIIIDHHFKTSKKENFQLSNFKNELEKNIKVALVSTFEKQISEKGIKLKYLPANKIMATAAKQKGLSFFPENNDGVTRSFLLNSKKEISLAAKLLPEKEQKHYEYLFKNSNISRKGLLRFKLVGDRVPVLSLIDSLGQKTIPDQLKNKTLIIGPTAPILHVQKQTPIGLVNRPELLGFSIQTLKDQKLQIIDFGWLNRLLHFTLGVILALIPFCDLFKVRWKPVLSLTLGLPIILFVYSYIPITHPPIGITYFAFLLCEISFLVMLRINQLNLINQSLHEAQLCGKIQQKFFPAKALKIEDHFSATGYCVPYQDAGGDYYDFHKLNDGRVFFLLGDVAGHGISASMMTTAAKSVVLLDIEKENFSVKDLFLDINSTILKMAKRKMMTTVAGTVDFENNKIEIYSAGHLPGVLKTKRGVEEIEIKGLPLGASKRFKLQESREIPIPDKGKIVFYSDGAVESLNWQNEELGFDDFLEIIDKVPLDATPEETIDQIFKGIYAHTAGRENQDDLTLLVLEFKN